MPEGTIIVDRRTKWGNPHRVGFCPVCGVDHTLAEAIAEFEAEVSQLPTDGYPLMELRGKHLGCWCKPGSPCHADVLLRLANDKLCNPPSK